MQEELDAVVIRLEKAVRGLGTDVDAIDRQIDSLAGGSDCPEVRCKAALQLLDRRVRGLPGGV